MPRKFSMKDLLNDTSRAETEKTSDKQKFVVHDIPYNKLKPSEQNKYGIRDVEELAAAIAEVGLLHNLVVADADKNGYYEIISGERRYTALGLLKWETVPCKIEKRKKDLTDELKLILANSTARELTDYEKMAQAIRLKDILQQMKIDGHKFNGRMRDIVADMLNVSTSQMQRYESIDKNLSDDWKSEFKAGRIGISAAYELSTDTQEKQAVKLEKSKKSGNPPSSKQKPKQEPKAQERVKAHELRKIPLPSKKAYATLQGDIGGQQIVKGKLAVIAAVNDDYFRGYISEGEATNSDIIILATALIAEFKKRLGDDKESIKTLQSNLRKLFKAKLT